MNKTKQIWPNGPFSLPDEEQFEKQLKKQKLVRNEFQAAGKYNMPINGFPIRIKSKQNSMRKI